MCYKFDTEHFFWNLCDFKIINLEINTNNKITLLMETVEQISISLARVFNLSLKEGVVPFEWKEANIIPLFKKG